MITETAKQHNPLVRSADVNRWDIYDIADELADVPAMISRIMAGQSQPGQTLDDVYGLLSDLENRLWEASKRGGNVGPYPEYKEV